MNLADIEFHPKVVNALRKARFETAEEIILLSSAELSTKLRIEDLLAKELLDTVSRALYPCEQRASTALAKFRQRDNRCLSLGDRVLNETLGGGIPTGGITEVFGRSAAGKTQLALQLCITVQLPEELGGLCGGAAFIATEQKFPIQRFAEMSHHFRERFPCLRGFDLMDNVHILHVRDLETQHHILCYQLPAMVELYGIRLVVVDSIAANFRGDEGGGTTTAADGTGSGFKNGFEAAPARARDLYEVGRVLKQLADRFDVAVVCLNQVSDVFHDSDVRGSVGGSMGGHAFLDVQMRGPSDDPSIERVVPTLGLTWSNLVNTRIMLSRRDTATALSPDGREGSHHVETITQAGVVGIEHE